MIDMRCNDGLLLNVSETSMQLMRLILFVFLLVASAAQGKFVPPSDGPVPFRRDKLPVDVDTMITLSNQLLLLAGSTRADNPAEARRAAQILALSAALDPSNRKSFEMKSRLEQDQPTAPADAKLVAQAKSRIWHLIGWLEQKEAGADGNALSACLADVLKGVDSNHPRAVQLAGKAEQGKWKNWVAAVDEFKAAEPVAKVDVPIEEPPVPDTSILLKLREASVGVPLWFVEKETKELTLRPVLLMMEAKIHGTSERLEIKFSNRELSEEFNGAGEKLQSFLEDRHQEIPAGLQYSFKIADNIPYARKPNGKMLLGAMLVLAESALSGTPPEGIVFVEPDSEGGLKTPARFWQTIRILADREAGTRLIIPTVAREFMPALITLEQADFFFNFEVVTADDVTALCERASSVPPEDLEAAHEVFETVRQARGSRSLGNFLSHDSTQQRLAQAVSLFPDHVSARMLALRGTSQWPTRLSREVFAHEIRASIEPLGSYFGTGKWRDVDGEEMEAKVDASREKLASAEKLYGSVSDRQELHAPALNFTKILGSLAIDAKRSSDRDGTRREHDGSYSEAWAAYVEVIGLLTVAAGDTLEYPAPMAETVR